jgi:hypothetical protein
MRFWHDVAIMMAKRIMQRQIPEIDFTLFMAGLFT